MNTAQLTRIKKTLDETLSFLNKINEIKEPDREYTRKIQQSVESLLDIPNYGILEPEVYVQINQVFEKLKKVMQMKCYQTNPVINLIINELFENFKYLIEYFLFLVENECLLKIN